MYPKITIDLDKIRKNTKLVLDKCKTQSIDIAAVNKVCLSDKEITKAVISQGVSCIADSRIINLINIKDFNVKKMLIRIPMLSEIDDVVKYSDITLVSHLETIDAIDIAAKKLDAQHEVILMIDLGDLRDGVFDEKEIYKICQQTTDYTNVQITGVAVNWACFGGIMPTKVKLQEFERITINIEKILQRLLTTISAGSSNCLHMIESDEIPNKVNHLRIGSAIHVGIGLNDIEIDWLNHNVYQLHAEIIEIRNKPSQPIGEKCLNAFGEETEFVDIGIIRRAIVALGRQDIDINNLIPVDKNIKILGSSSDHIILHIPDSYKLGDIIKFNLTYAGCLQAMTSPHVHKEYINK